MKGYKVLCCLACLLLLSLLGGCQDTSISDGAVFSKGLLPVQNNGVWGYINTKNEYKISPQYEGAKPFAENGLAAVSVNGMWGYINTKGEMEIETAYHEAATFHKDLAIVKVDGLYGYINSKGEMVIPAIYQEAFPFAENELARVGLDDQYGYINMSGEWVITPQYSEAADFASNGLAAAVLEEQVGYIDAGGNFVIPPMFEEAGKFTDNGLALASEDGSLYGYIDAQGVWAIEPQYDAAENFSDGIAIVEKNNGIFGINEEGEILFTLGNDYTVGNFHDGKAWCYNQNSGYGGYIDAEGKQVIAEQFKAQNDDTLNRFGTDHYAVVRIGDYYGVANAEGKFLVNPQYEAVGQTKLEKNSVYADSAMHRLFKNGIAQFFQTESDGSWGGYIYQTKDGTHSIHVKDGEEPGENGMTAVSIDGEKWGYIDEKCEIVIEPRWTRTWNFSNGFARIQNNDLYGYINEQGEIVSPGNYLCNFDFQENGKVFVVNYTGNWAIVNSTGQVKELNLRAEIPYICTPLQNGYTILSNYIVDEKGSVVYELGEHYYSCDISKDLRRVFIWGEGIFDTSVGQFKEFPVENLWCNKGTSNYENYVVYTDTDEARRYGVMDETGEFFIPLVYDRIQETSIEGIYEAISDTGEHQLLDERGNILFETTEDEMIGGVGDVIHNILFVKDGFFDLETAEFISTEENEWDEEKGTYHLTWETPGFVAEMGVGERPSNAVLWIEISRQGQEKQRYTVTIPKPVDSYDIWEPFLGNYVSSSAEVFFQPGPSGTWWFRDGDLIQLITRDGEMPFEKMRIEKAYNIFGTENFYWAYRNGKWNYIDEEGEILISQEVLNGGTNSPYLREEDEFIYLCTPYGVGQVYDQEGKLLAEYQCLINS